MKKLLIAIFIKVLAVPVLADDSLPDLSNDYLLRANPNELVYASEHPTKGCGFNEATGREIVEGVMIRSRIKPLNLYKLEPTISPEMGLSVDIQCMALEGNNPVYVISVQFGLLQFYPRLLDSVDYGSLGIGPKGAIKDAVQDAVA